jgi:hypothetical protein
LEAEIVLAYDDARMAEAVARAISPDNFKTPLGLKVTTETKDGRIFTMITCESSLGTFIATIDDLLSCVSIAEKTVQTMRKLE